jgi:hypothetical protein
MVGVVASTRVHEASRTVATNAAMLALAAEQPGKDLELSNMQLADAGAQFRAAARDEFAPSRT